MAGVVIFSSQKTRLCSFFGGSVLSGLSESLKLAPQKQVKPSIPLQTWSYFEETTSKRVVFESPGRQGDKRVCIFYFFRRGGWGKR